MFHVTAKELQDIVTLLDQRVVEIEKNYYSAGDHFGYTQEDIAHAKSLRNNFDHFANMVARHKADGAFIDTGVKVMSYPPDTF